MQSIADHILDLRGMIIPVTLLRIMHKLREIESGETIEIVGSDLETKKVLFKVLRAFPYELLKVNDQKKVYRVRLKKKSSLS